MELKKIILYVENFKTQVKNRTTSKERKSKAHHHMTFRSHINDILIKGENNGKSKRNSILPVLKELKVNGEKVNLY